MFHYDIASILFLAIEKNVNNKSIKPSPNFQTYFKLVASSLHQSILWAMSLKEKIICYNNLQSLKLLPFQVI